MFWVFFVLFLKMTESWKCVPSREEKKAFTFLSFDFLAKKKPTCFFLLDSMWHFAMYLICQNEKNSDAGNYTHALGILKQLF